MLQGPDLAAAEASLRRALATLLRSRRVLREVTEQAVADETGVAQRTALASAMAKRCMGILHRLVMLCKRQGQPRERQLGIYKAAYGHALRNFGDAPASGLVGGQSLSSEGGLQALLRYLDAVVADVRSCLDEDV